MDNPLLLMTALTRQLGELVIHILLFLQQLGEENIHHQRSGRGGGLVQLLGLLHKGSQPVAILTQLLYPLTIGGQLIL